MFDVIASLLSSIIFKNLLYLNLAPYLFNSEESAYFVVFACTEDSTVVPLGAKLLLKYIFESISRISTSNQEFLVQYLLHYTF